MKEWTKLIILACISWLSWADFTWKLVVCITTSKPRQNTFQQWRCLCITQLLSCQAGSSWLSLRGQQVLVQCRSESTMCFQICFELAWTGCTSPNSMTFENPVACSALTKSSLQAWTSTIVVDIFPEGPIHTQRLDILLGTGHGHKGIKTCTPALTRWRCEPLSWRRLSQTYLSLMAKKAF